MSSEIERLRAERDALASALEEALDGIAHNYDWPVIAEVLNRALMGRSHHAERVRLERAVVEAARDYDTWRHDPGTTDGHLRRLLGKLSAALAALDAHERKEQADGM